MCGIIGAFHTGDEKTPVNEVVLNQFENQKERGTNGFGIIKINAKMGYKIDRATEGYKFMWDIHHNPVRAMIVHHRTPTSSDNKIEQTHPILVDNGSLQFKYLLIHNGMVRNDDELKEEHEKLGFIYNTIDKRANKFNDSECVAIEVARFIEGQIDKIGIKGGAAFVCIQINKKSDTVNKLYFGRNDIQPLNMAKTRNKMIISSTGPGTEVKALNLYECKLDAEMKLSSKKMNFIIEPPITTTYPHNANANRTALEKEAKTCFNNYPARINSALPATVPNSIKRDTSIMDDEDWTDHYAGGRLFKREYNSDIPTEQEDDEFEEFHKILDEGTENLQQEIDSFVDLLYDQTTAEALDEKDIELSLQSLKWEMETLLQKVKEIYFQASIAAEADEHDADFQHLKEIAKEEKTPIGFTAEA